MYFSSDFSATSDALKYDCCPTLYPFVLYTIRIRRRSLYYFTNIVGNRVNQIDNCQIHSMSSVCSSLFSDQLYDYYGISFNTG